jgi:hypothetical protein
MKKSSDIYFRIKKERKEYLGDRYFRMNYDFEKVIQVCFTCGDSKKGKSNTVGIYCINKLTFMSNYFMYYVEPCTKAQYDKAFDNIIKILQ